MVLRALAILTVALAMFNIHRVRLNKIHFVLLLSYLLKLLDDDD